MTADEAKRAAENFLMAHDIGIRSAILGTLQLRDALAYEFRMISEAKQPCPDCGFKPGERDAPDNGLLTKGMQDVQAR